MSDLESKFKEIRTKHNLILPCVKQENVRTVSFTFNEGDSKRHTYWYFKRSTHWEYFGGNETPEATAVMDDLTKVGIITEDGKVNFEHRI